LEIWDIKDIVEFFNQGRKKGNPRLSEWAIRQAVGHREIPSWRCGGRILFNAEDVKAHITKKMLESVEQTPKKLKMAK